DVAEGGGGSRYRAKRDRLVGPEEPEEGSQFVERSSACVVDLDERSVSGSGIALEPVRSNSRPDGDRRQRMGDDVVQVVGDAKAFRLEPLGDLAFHGVRSTPHVGAKGFGGGDRE